MKDLIADMKPKTQGIMRSIFKEVALNRPVMAAMNAYIAMLQRRGYIKYRYISKGTFAVGITLTRKGLDQCLMSKCTRDIRELV